MQICASLTKIFAATHSGMFLDLRRYFALLTCADLHLKKIANIYKILVYYCIKFFKYLLIIYIIFLLIIIFKKLILIYIIFTNLLLTNFLKIINYKFVIKF